MTELTTTRQVIDALGGTKAVADLLGCKMQRVTNWKRARAFPFGADEALKPELGRRGLAVSPALWTSGKPWVAYTPRERGSPNGRAA
jgi:hypothetical protein